MILSEIEDMDQYFREYRLQGIQYEQDCLEEEIAELEERRARNFWAGVHGEEEDASDHGPFGNTESEGKEKSKLKDLRARLAELAEEAEQLAEDQQVDDAYHAWDLQVSGHQSHENHEDNATSESEEPGKESSTGESESESDREGDQKAKGESEPESESESESESEEYEYAVYNKAEGHWEVHDAGWEAPRGSILSGNRYSNDQYRIYYVGQKKYIYRMDCKNLSGGGRRFVDVVKLKLVRNKHGGYEAIVHDVLD